MKMNAMDWIAFLLVAVGGLNWGLVGFFKFDLVAELLGEMSGLARVVYGLVGLATIYLVGSAASKSMSSAAHAE